MAKSGGAHRVSRLLERHIRSVGADQPLPSFRTLIKECRVSPATVQRVIRAFELRKIVVVKPNRGIFTATVMPSAQVEGRTFKVIDVLYVGAELTRPAPTQFRRDLMKHLATAPAALGSEVRLHGITDGPESFAQIHDVAEDEKCEACILVNLRDQAQSETLRRAHVPFVCLYPECASFPRHNAITVDADELVAKQLNHLIALGHRRIGYLHSVDPHIYHRSHLLRREAFFRMALDHTLPISSAMVQFGGLDSATSKTGARAILTQQPRPTALICHDEHLAEVYAVAGEMGLIVGRDLSVVGTDDDEIARQVHPAATTVAVPRQAAVQVALAMLQEVLRSVDGLLPNRTVDAPLIERHSTGRVPQ